MGKPIFTLISKANCPWCFRAKQELAQRGYEFKVQLIGKDISLEEVKNAYREQKVVPIVVIQDNKNAPRRVLGSYNDLLTYLSTAIKGDENGNSEVHTNQAHGEGSSSNSA